MTRRSPTTKALADLQSVTSDLELLTLCTAGPARDVSRRVLLGVVTAVESLLVQQERTRAKAGRRAAAPAVLEGEDELPFA
jgi:hypothetical protein